MFTNYNHFFWPNHDTKLDFQQLITPAGIYLIKSPKGGVI